jgi:hypothetical protein
MITEILKIDTDKHLIFGFASCAEYIDKQGDLIGEGDLEASIYDYVADSRETGEMHRKRGVAKLVESCFFSIEKQKILGIDLGHPLWWLGFRVEDAKVWDKVKSGAYRGFSISGSAIREAL